MTPHRLDSQISIIELVISIRKRPLFFLGCFAALFALVVAVYFILPRKYISEGKFFVQVGRSSVGTDPTTSSGTISLQDSRETEVNSVVTMLESREVAAAVVDKIGAERILEPVSMIGKLLESMPALSFSSEMSGAELTKEEVDELTLKNKAINYLLKQLDVDHEKKTTVVSVAAPLQTPFLARDVVDAYLQEYQKMHIKINQRTASNTFFEEQYQQYDGQLRKAEEKLQEYRDSIDALTIAGARNLLQQEINQLTLDRVSTEINLQQEEEKAKQLGDQLKSLPRFINRADVEVSSLARDKATEALFNLQVQASELESRLSEDDPRLKAKRSAVENATRDLETIPKTFSQSEKSVSSTFQQAQVLHMQAETSAKALRKRLDGIDSAIAEKKQLAKKMNSIDVVGKSLQRKIQVEEDTLMKMASKRSESQTIGALDSQNISNVKVAQQASLVLKKVFPSGMVFGVLGLVFAFIGATLLTFLREISRFLVDEHRQSQPVRNSGRPSEVNISSQQPNRVRSEIGENQTEVASHG